MKNYKTNKQEDFVLLECSPLNFYIRWWGMALIMLIFGTIGGFILGRAL